MGKEDLWGLWGAGAFRTGWVCYDTYITGRTPCEISTALIKAGGLFSDSQHPGLFSGSEPREDAPERAAGMLARKSPPPAHKLYSYGHGSAELREAREVAPGWAASLLRGD